MPIALSINTPPRARRLSVIVHVAVVIHTRAHSPFSTHTGARTRADPRWRALYRERSPDFKACFWSLARGHKEGLTVFFVTEAFLGGDFLKSLLTIATEPAWGVFCVGRRQKSKSIAPRLQPEWGRFRQSGRVRASAAIKRYDGLGLAADFISRQDDVPSRCSGSFPRPPTVRLAQIARTGGANPPRLFAILCIDDTLPRTMRLHGEQGMQIVFAVESQYEECFSYGKRSRSRLATASKVSTFMSLARCWRTRNTAPHDCRSGPSSEDRYSAS
jgi:hypothetical protein